MTSICNISEHFCDWRSHVDKGDSIQAYDGRGWFAATVYSVRRNPKTTKDLLVGYNNYSSSYDFWCAYSSKRIRPTIGFLRKKIMAPQATEIKSLRKENERLKEQNEQLLRFKNKYDEQEYEYLPLKKLSIDTDKENDDSLKNLEVSDREDIEDLLMSNVKILAEWNKITKELHAINDELNEIVDINEHDCISEHHNLNIKDLVRIQTMIEKRIEIQQQRLESSQNSVITPVMTQKFKIDENINEYQRVLNALNEENSENAEKYKIVKNDCKQLIDSLRDLHLYCNQKIKEEHLLSKCQNGFRNKSAAFQNYVEQYQDYSGSYFDLLKGFQKFQVLNKEYVSNSYKQINYGWQKIESLWCKWQSDDTLLWIQHKMSWMNKNTVPNCLNFDIILENMQRNQINGMSLLKMKKIDLLHIGFTINSHRIMIYSYIQALITKNKIPRDETEYICCNYAEQSDNSNHNEGEETRLFTTYDGDSMIPEKYKCSLTHNLMCEPVICGHNNKVFEKSAIHNYINEYHKLPLLDTSSMSQININDDASFLLFDDLSLKIEIEQFKQEHDL